jgi:hypothetical protein
MQSRLTVMFDAFLDNLSGVALFGKLRWPGAPTEMIDSRTVQEYKESGEFDDTVYRYRAAVDIMRYERDRAAAKDHEEHAISGHVMSSR